MDYQTRKPTEEEVRSWWQRWPDANLAVITGATSGVVVVDLDGLEAVQYARKKGGLPACPAVRTGKGWHCYFAHPGGHIPSKARLVELPSGGIDIRADGGMAVLPPSLHPSGRKYTWRDERHSPWGMPLPPIPIWVLELLERATTSAQNGGGGGNEKLDPLAVLAGVPEGQRDVTLFRYACRLRAQGLTREEAERLVLEAARNCRPPFPEKEALRKVAQAWKYPPGKAAQKAAQLASGMLPRLPGRIAVPDNWDRRTVVVTLDWLAARQALAEGKAVVVAYPDFTVPHGAGGILREAEEIEVLAEGEQKERLSWALHPFLVLTGRVSVGAGGPDDQPDGADSAVPARIGGGAEGQVGSTLVAPTSPRVNGLPGGPDGRGDGVFEGDPGHTDTAPPQVGDAGEGSAGEADASAGGLDVGEIAVHMPALGAVLERYLANFAPEAREKVLLGVYKRWEDALADAIDADYPPAGDSAETNRVLKSMSVSAAACGAALELLLRAAGCGHEETLRVTAMVLDMMRVDMLLRAGVPPSELAREAVRELLDKHGIWVYRSPRGNGWGWAKYEPLCPLPVEAQALLVQLIAITPAVVASAAMVPPAPGDVVEAVGREGVVVEAKIPVQVAVRFPDSDTPAYIDPHPWVMAPVAPGRWRVGF